MGGGPRVPCLCPRIPSLSLIYGLKQYLVFTSKGYATVKDFYQLHELKMF